MSDERASEGSLLPAGLQDLLSPDARHESALVDRLLASFSDHGYRQVKPPLLEFEEALLSGAGIALGPQTFRLMDPVSQRMMGFRADITPQVARLAASRLAMAARPLRLCYAGEVLRVRGGQLRPERQFTQVGVELIEAAQPNADAEVIALGAEALTALGVESLSVDINLPPLVHAIAQSLDLAPAMVRQLRDALDRKDADAVRQVAGSKAEPFLALLRAAGPAPEALRILKALELAPDATREIHRLAHVVARIDELRPGLALTLDPAEHRGFEYQTGISFVFFARGVRGELGRGGRYETIAGGTAENMSSTGFTLFMDSVTRALPPAQERALVFLPWATPPEEGRRLRAEGRATIAALDDSAPARQEAIRMGCSFLWQEGELVNLVDESK